MVEPPDSNGHYILSFDRTVRNCVGQANTGLGDPLGGSGAFNSAGIASVNFVETATDELTVRVFNSSTSSFVDSSFLISVFC